MDKIDLKQERIDCLNKYLDTLRYKHGWGVPMEIVDAIKDRIELIKKGEA